jgi:uroporphyrinogen-III synthase
VLHGAENPPLASYILSRGATVASVQPYVYAPASDAEKVADLIGSMSQENVDLLVITSSPQVDRLFDVAAQRGLDDTLKLGFSKTRVAAVGPVAAQSLESRGVHVEICPEQGFVMKKLVQLITRALAR